jgi:hypothetical protein
MKTVNIAIWILLLTFNWACQENEDDNSFDVTGVYNGTYTIESEYSSKSLSIVKNASVTIKKTGNQLQAYCLGDEIEKEFTMDYFEHHEEIRVCLNGTEYFHLYGHQHGERMNSGSGMHHNMNPDTSWERHLNAMHPVGEVHHNNGFNSQNNTFRCTFSWNGKIIAFQGTK